ncbi:MULTISPECIES: DUF502 domain-containing protein [Laceyella]|uniref:Uncharacterized membrane protein n=3 Tax=Laceyella TaxID=292635 RepID=A0AA45WMB6_9BACL|nr:MULTISPECIES: DUF502 domain-containing protein [Laceyella]PRZ17280.1 putative membrane protein [Laceyella sediminis]TCW37819.1 putative membrane protein [Laceyella sacchari]UWE02956.1 DUF502 domain-containing protein [Laceyella sacchari]SMP13926.1 Uncharacterized membrane protein [Laceyella tengchongensis]
MRRNGLIKRLSIYFLNGLLVFLPIALTVYLVRYIYQLLNNLGMNWAEKVLPWSFPGMGLLFVIALILVIGFLTKLWLTKKLFDMIEAILDKIPLVRDLYGTLKDTIHSFIGEKKSFDTVVFVHLGGSRKLGFLTVKAPVFRTADGKEYVGVYFPQSYQFSGDLHWYEREQVEELDMSVDDALRLIISGGVTHNHKSHLP